MGLWLLSALQKGAPVLSSSFERGVMAEQSMIAMSSADYADFRGSATALRSSASTAFACAFSL